MNNYGGDLILNSKLERIIDNLHSNKLNIISEKREIKNAQILLDRFKKSLEEQNEDLNIIIEKKYQLEKEISDNSDEFINDKITEMNSERINLKRKNLELICDIREVMDRTSEDFNIIGKERRISEDDANESIPVMFNRNILCDHSVVPPAEMSLKPMEFKTLKGVIVSAISSRHDCGMFIGGSNGYLMKYSNKEEHVYQPHVRGNIIQIEIVKAQKPILVAFSRNNVFVFEYLTDQRPFKKISLSEIKTIYNEGTLFYIILAKGRINTINRSNWRIEDYMRGDYFKDGLLFPSSINSKYFLVSLKNKFYKTKNKDLSNLEIIDGVENVKKVLKVNEVGFFCHSADMIWFMNEDCELIDSLKFVNGVKFIQCSDEYGVVVDRTNVVHVYILIRKCNFGKKIFERQMKGIVTAMDMNDDHVFVAVHDVVYDLNLK